MHGGQQRYTGVSRDTWGLSRDAWGSAEMHGSQQRWMGVSRDTWGLSRGGWGSAEVDGGYAEMHGVEQKVERKCKVATKEWNVKGDEVEKVEEVEEEVRMSKAFSKVCRE